jgi:hypothetical protein
MASHGLAISMLCFRVDPGGALQRLFGGIVMLPCHAPLHVLWDRIPMARYGDPLTAKRHLLGHNLRQVRLLQAMLTLVELVHFA